jgi:hypothetical protein
MITLFICLLFVAIAYFFRLLQLIQIAKADINTVGTIIRASPIELASEVSGHGTSALESEYINCH